MNITNPDEIARKLEHISRLTPEELIGWKWARRIDMREPFDGENEAIAAREKQLRMWG